MARFCYEEVEFDSNLQSLRLLKDPAVYEHTLDKQVAKRRQLMNNIDDTLCQKNERIAMKGARPRTYDNNGDGFANVRAAARECGTIARYRQSSESSNEDDQRYSARLVPAIDSSSAAEPESRGKSPNVLPPNEVPNYNLLPEKLPPTNSANSSSVHEKTASVEHSRHPASLTVPTPQNTMQPSGTFPSLDNSQTESPRYVRRTQHQSDIVEPVTNPPRNAPPRFDVDRLRSRFTNLNVENNPQAESLLQNADFELKPYDLDAPGEMPNCDTEELPQSNSSFAHEQTAAVEPSRPTFSTSCNNVMEPSMVVPAYQSPIQQSKMAEKSFRSVSSGRFPSLDNSQTESPRFVRHIQHQSQTVEPVTNPLQNGPSKLGFRDLYDRSTASNVKDAPPTEQLADFSRPRPYVDLPPKDEEREATLSRRPPPTRPRRDMVADGIPSYNLISEDVFLTRI
uniref:Uncharacterized protein n=1 Tax=Panagrolaimus sp. JU765 TaxID=591449 RepID=A0AC34RB96_9BILA